LVIFLNKMIISREGNMVPKVIDEKCNACESCVQICPTEAITIQNDIAVIDDSICDECGVCVDECPEEAIFIPEEE
jgi:NAD-dependent dihydropyrimidine dehydrogenase PreA subunit